MIFFCVGWFVFLSFLCLPVVSFFILSLQLFWKRENLGIKQKAFFFSWICYVVVQVCHSKLMRKTDTKKKTFQPKTKIGKLLQRLMLQCFLCFLFHFVGYSSAPCTMPVFSPDDVQVTTETQHETLDASSGFGKDDFK